MRCCVGPYPLDRWSFLPCSRLSRPAIVCQTRELDFVAMISGSSPTLRLASTSRIALIAPQLSDWFRPHNRAGITMGHGCIRSVLLGGPCRYAGRTLPTRVHISYVVLALAYSSSGLCTKFRNHEMRFVVDDALYHCLHNSQSLFCT